jgi:hypothetical protein
MALPIIGMADRYRWPVLSMVVWLMLAFLALLTVPIVARRGLRGWESAGLLTAAVLAEVLIGATCRGYNVVGVANWALLGAGWLLMATAVHRPIRDALLGAAALTAVGTVLTLDEVGPTPLALARLTAMVWGLWVPLLAIAVIQRAMASVGPTVARTMATEADLNALAVSAAAVRADRTRRWDMLETRTLPLVRAIANGLLDPSDEAVRSRCAAQAATLRRLLTGTTSADLERVIASAERRGLRVETQLSGDLRGVPADARDAIARMVEASLASVTAGHVLLTVLGGTDEAQVFVSFPAPPPGARAIHLPDTGHSGDGRLDALTDMVDGRGSLQLRWNR